MVLALASASPRRKALLEAAGIEHRVLPVHVDESLPPGLDPRASVSRLAERKARAAARRLGEGAVLAADTAVWLDGKMLGKPGSPAEAVETLGRLSGREHVVLTGVCLIDAATGETVTRVVSSRVRFRELSREEIEAYVATGEPLDKAGAYGIQGAASAFVAELEGSYENVVGLPVEEVREMLEELG
jgi:septum formation protein